MDRITLDFEPSKVNKYELGVEYFVEEEWFEKIPVEFYGQPFEVMTFDEKIKLTLKVGKEFGRKTVVINAVDSSEPQSFYFQNCSVALWNINKLIVELERLTTSSAHWEDNRVDVGNVVIWLTEHNDIEEFLIYDVWGFGDLDIKDDLLVGAILNTKHISAITMDIRNVRGPNIIQDSGEANV